MITLHNVDCMTFMAGLPDKAFDLAIVDPPYGISIMTSGGKGVSGWINHERKAWDNAIPGAEYFTELRRVSMHQIVWGGNYMTEHLSPSMGWVFWDKGQRDFTLADGELAWTSFPRAMRVFEFARGSANREDKVHPTQKPVALYRWLLKNYAKPGQRILDTHLGSGSSAIACDLEGFDFTGTEIDLDYYLGAAKRLKDHQSAPRLFAPEALVQPVQTPLFE